MKVKTEQEIIAYRKFLYEDEYPDGNYPEDLLYPKSLSLDDIKQECDFAKKHEFKYFLYCPNCNDSWIGANGLNKDKHPLNVCSTCNYDKVKVFDVNTYREVL